MADIELQRTRLRRFKISDLQNMIELESDPDVMKFTPSRVPLSRERSKERLEDLISKEKTHGEFGVWAAEFKDTGEFLGWFMLLKRDLEYPELGFMIVKKHWNKGLTTEAAAGLVQYGFTFLGLSGISAATTLDNCASQKVLTKIGFSKVKSSSIPDSVLNHDIGLEVFEILK